MSDVVRVAAIILGWLDCFAIAVAIIGRSVWADQQPWKTTILDALAIMVLFSLMWNGSGTVALVEKGIASSLLVGIGFRNQNCEWTPQWLILLLAGMFAPCFVWEWGRPTWAMLDSFVVIVVAIHALRVVSVNNPKKRLLLIYALVIFIGACQLLTNMHVRRTGAVSLDDLVYGNSDEAEP
jgi:hypothetical protein